MKKEKLLILIVDDNMNFVKRIISLMEDLKNIGYINVATDYNEAVKFIDEEKPDLVLLDINLPGKSGIELLRRIKETGSKSEVIMITNHTDDYYKKLCHDLGAKYFLDKSIEFAMVPDIIGSFHLN
ncbi:MAG TPA: response regulator transcription factor [Chitinophagaceae bacterium]|jgi:DNA-binding response OmpR family regulator|nr:response regulator transcription factor [Chitinophagaceae bacterium]